MQKIENKSSFGIIARIYHSDLSSIMRNDCACRIIAKLADADAVSILLYDGEKDRLVNHGTYINADSIVCIDLKKAPNRVAAESHILKYITVYDFLLDRFHDLGIPVNIPDSQIVALMKEFKSSTYKHFNYGFFEEELPKSEYTMDFLRTCINYSIQLAATDKPVRGYYILDKDKFYSIYKKKFKEAEEYIIGTDVPNLSGRLYHHTVAESDRKIEVYNADRPFIHHEDLMDIRTQPHKAFNSFLVSTLGYSLKKDLKSSLPFSYCYTGIPIWSGNRCLGVVRIMTNAANGPLTHDDDTGKGSRVRHATEMLGYFLDQSYAEQFVDDIYHDWSELTAISKNKNGGNVSLSRISSNRHNRFCSKLRKAMNSFGCILRLSNFSLNAPRIVGKSTDPKEFRKFVETFVEKYDSLIEGKNFNKNLAQYFPSTNRTEERSLMKSDFRLIGISVELNYTDPSMHKSTYYYCTKRVSARRTTCYVVA